MALGGSARMASDAASLELPSSQIFKRLILQEKPSGGRKCSHVNCILWLDDA